MSSRNEAINEAIIELLWDSLTPDPNHKHRRQTGWGTKTQKGLIACIERIVAKDFSPPETKSINLPIFGIKVVLAGSVKSGTIVSELDRFVCPNCNEINCVHNCDQSQSDFSLESDKDMAERLQWNASMDTVESVILGHACAGIDIQQDSYLEGIRTVIDGVTNQ